jgi:hypothetical protein
MEFVKAWMILQLALFSFAAIAILMSGALSVN